MTVAVCTLLLATATVPCVYYAVLYALGRCRRTATSPADPLYLTVLIPAHNEAGQLPHTLRSLAAADYPASHLRVLVVADNCTDSTAAMAKLHGADVITRTDPAHHGKGFALAFGLPHAVAGCDAVIVLDADCTVNRDFLRRMSDGLRHADAVQAAVCSTNTATPAGYVAAVGSRMDNATAAGLNALGGRVPLRGTGMGFRRTLLERLPWVGFGPAEDVEYAATLAAHGVRVRCVPDAEVRCEAPADGGAFGVQRKRWSAALRVGVFGLLNSKPLVLAHLSVVAVLVLVLSPSPVLVGWLVGLVALTAGTYITAAVPFGWPSLRVFGVVGRLLMLAVVAGRNQQGRWERTPRR
jgi:cellulose synthase/poly-beta-1,6-N-acetylglucosamine synthase-like glycosyltransferase